MVEKSLDLKLAEIHANPNSKAFIIADAKDADMAFGISSPGSHSPEYHHGELRYRTIQEYRDIMRQVVHQGLVDIMLMSASSNEVLAIQERLFDASHITPAARANDTSEIHLLRGSCYNSMASRPFRSATIDHMQCGKHECAPEERNQGCNLGLYSITLNNDLERDLAILTAYKNFRIEAEAKGFRHFLEVFDPNLPNAVDPEKLPGFINDAIARTLAGVTKSGLPIFLKVVYHGPKAMEELVAYNSDLVIGIMGGSSGTTHDAFKLIADAQKYGGRVALYGRKINNSEHQLSFIKFLRLIVDGEIEPAEAVAAYHGVLQGLNIKPERSLQDDIQLTAQVFSYGGKTPSVTVPAEAPATPKAVAQKPSGLPPVSKEELAPVRKNAKPWDSMSAQEKIEHNQKERDRIFG
ncbi:MAG: hypothetical protein P9L94_11495 [Candidatus Hinthialibacter antarcticus]|nr:hypothetical protein [Candidatus Hinthialibacter antarcticus]